MSELVDDRVIAASVAINPHYRRVGDRILVGSRWVDGADAASFEIIDGKYAADRDHIYYADILCRIVNSPMHSNNEVPCVVDRASFRVLAEDFACDRAHVYWQNDVVYGVAPDEFSVLPRGTDRHDAWFGRDHGRVLYFYAGIHRSEYDAANRRYLGLVPIVIDGADPNTFEALGGLYGRDDRRVYYHGHLIAGADAQRIRSCGGDLLITDQAVYFSGDAVEDADPASFEILGDGYARDRARVFCTVEGDDPYLTTVDDADPASFEILGDGYARDRARSYYYTWACISSGADRLRANGDGFAVTADAVLFQGRIIPGADPASFVWLPTLTLAYDRQRVYRHVLVDCDPDRFDVVVLEAADPRELSPLLDQLCARPDAAELLAVYGDQLADRGDRRGELIAIQLARSGPGGDHLALSTSERELTDELTRRLHARLGQATIARWRNGFVDELELDLLDAPQPSALSRLSLLAEARLLRRLVLREAPQHALGELSPVLRELAELAYALPHLEDLTVISRVSPIGDVSPVCFAYSKLRALVLDGPAARLPRSLHLGALERFRAPQLAGPEVAQLANAYWPRLVALELGLAPAPDLGDPAETFAAVLDREAPRDLASVSLAAPTGMAGVIERVLRSRLTSRVRDIGFVGATLDLAAVDTLLDRAAALERFSTIRLSRDPLDATARARLDAVLGGRLVWQ